MSVRRTPWVDAAFGVAFAVAIATPLVMMLVRSTANADHDVILQREQRHPTPAPSLPTDVDEFVRFPRDAERWYSERFGLRAELMHAFHWSKLMMFDESPTDSLRVGRDGWIFSDVLRALDCLRGAYPMTQDELDRWRISTLRKRDWLADRGIDYALVIVPGKGSVYPEQLPRGYDIVGPSRRDQLLAELAKVPQVNVIDLLPVFREARAGDAPDDHLYFPLGLHWTPRGALIGYRAVMEALPERHRTVPPLDFDDFRKTDGGRGDDFSHSFLVEDLFTQVEYNLQPVGNTHGRRAKRDASKGDCWFPSWTDGRRQPTTALFQRDSFGTMVLPSFATQFERITDCANLQFSPAVVDAVQPDIVIELWVEHTLGYETPLIITEFEQDGLARRFEELDEVLVAPPADGAGPRMTGLRGTLVDDAPDGTRVHVDSIGVAHFEPCSWRDDATTILRLEMTAPANTYATFFYPLPGLSRYRLKQSSQMPVRAGRQTIYVELPPQRYPGAIALGPGCANGAYVVHSAEIRTSHR